MGRIMRSIGRLDQLPDFVGRPRADLDVMTTLDRPMQLAAERAINRVLAAQGEARHAGQAMVVMTPDGAIRAMVGGRAYGKANSTAPCRHAASQARPLSRWCIWRRWKTAWQRAMFSMMRRSALMAGRRKIMMVAIAVR